MEIKCHHVKTKDDFSTTEGINHVNRILETITYLSAKYRESKGLPEDYTRIPRNGKVDKCNWGLQYLINSMPAFEEWLDTAPSSDTVESFYNPNLSTLPSGTKIDEGSRSLLAYTKDGMGLRSRAKILSELMTKDLEPGEKWLSLACGGAVPCIKAIEMAEHKPKLTLVDYDTHNLRLAKKRVISMGLKGTVNTAWRDLTSEKSFESVPYIKGLFSWFVLRKPPLFLNRRLPLNSYDRVECTGFMEYLPKEKAARFVSNAFELLKSTGTFITSNIRDTHSQRAFTEGVVQWPFIQFRSVDEVVEIIESSKINVNTIDVYLPDDEVYAVYVMRQTTA